MENLDIYNLVRSVPEQAKKTITGGRLSGMTDIKPMWRIEKLTEIFGICGIGWKTKITNKEIIEGANGEKIAIVDIELYVKINGEWSEAIEGTGGSSFIAKERNGYYTSDECFKMAYTDALSVACKSIGMGADVYWGDSKYKTDDKPKTKKVTKSKQQENADRFSMEFKVDFGKYEGKTWIEIYSENPTYFEWLYEQAKAKGKEDEGKKYLELKEMIKNSFITINEEE